MYGGQRGHNLRTGKDQLRHDHLGRCGGWPLFIYWQRQISLAFHTWQVLISDWVSMGGGTSVSDWLLVGDVQIPDCSQLFPCQHARQKRWPGEKTVQHFSGSKIGLGFCRPAPPPAVTVFTQLSSLSSITLIKTCSCRFFAFISALIQLPCGLP